MILLDSNVFMYAAGAEHPHKRSSLAFLERVARARLDGDDRLMARDALHAAVASLHAADAICSYDRDFDRIEGIRRIEPQAARATRP